ncbi:CDP-diacylglycerol--glycerol-3-phosphate 3-phosphatidyltransferase [Allobaculum mucilyticum]|uniref:CDP-diacylglycerol--glycerol-3-phosphate 3-phosphatidyltransferase n=1 Tax=Allobaculum mucilyticum TaxID=2834459 RepID=UPI0024160979|nr:CDP-diacylglycerol--glycerol-3-phosphate 3-phosphatidyltransferase [Allobaculum mucilyticum]
MKFWNSLNVPNKLTVLRMLMVPLIWIIYLCIPQDFLLMSKEAGFGLRNLLVLIVFILASLTDYADGQIARKKHLITSFGKFLDPIADKMLVNTTLILLVYGNEAAIVPVLLMISRDLVVDGLRLSAAAQGTVVSAGFPGKLKTVLQMAAIILLVLGNWPFVYMHIPVASIVLWLAAAVSLYSGWVYFVKLKDYVLESM